MTNTVEQPWVELGDATCEREHMPICDDWDLFTKYKVLTDENGVHTFSTQSDVKFQPEFVNGKTSYALNVDIKYGDEDYEYLWTTDGPAGD